ncbi:hypothetical protein [Candidatus Magnetobacterium casense]|uniref:hypothetical protein n=1 Tax=Candidatus Magnetobacterium casense TaxID=1455061 RepID=UPI00190FA124|nr:hypothetical protein [Candidatus Magnetobacterium casensis]
MDRLSKYVLVAGCMCMFCAGVAFAGDPVINWRERNQQRRIDQGVKSGQLTPDEARRLERREANIRQTESRMKSDGKLTKQERRKLMRMENRTSKKIYNLKHNNRRVPD